VRRLKVMSMEVRSTKPKVSVVMPAYNVGRKIDRVLGSLLKTLESITKNYEVIIVDDGSQKPPSSSMISLDSKVKVIRHKVNMGKGEAIKTGVRHATGDYTILMDADGDISSRNIKQYIIALKEYDVIVGSKRHPKSMYKAPAMRKFLSLSFNTIVKLLTGIKLGDTQTGLKAFKTKHLKTIMNTIVVKRYTWDVEALLVANLLKLKVAEAPVYIKQDSRFSFRAVLDMFVEILGITYRYRILRWYQKNLGKQNPEYKPLLKI
jgi:glycosyltransferase involved in cell wall biosynthesis